MLFSSRVRGNLVRSFLAVVVSAAVSACSPAALVVVWPPSKWIPAIVAASYTPEKIDRGFRDERPVLAEAISRNFPNEYLAILEEASTQVRRGNIQPLPINSQFGGYAAFATDGALNAAIEAQIAYLLQGVEASTGACADKLPAEELELALREATDVAIAEGIETPVSRSDVTGVGVPFIRMYLAQHGVDKAAADAIFAGRTSENCGAYIHFLEALNLVDVPDAKALRAKIVAATASLM
jgi:hypothetical protein